MKKAYVLYANDNYFDIVSMCAKSIRTFSPHPIIVYMLNSDRKVDVKDTTSIRWDCNIDEFSDDGMYENHEEGSNFYVNRSNDKIYNLLIQRPLVVRDALIYHADVVVYVDCDSVATPYVDRLFDMYNVESVHPYITEGIYNYLYINGRGGTTEKETLEYNACQLFGIDQKNRFVYRTTNVFVAGKKTIDFLEEWYLMCIHPAILKDFKQYAPFHEETIVNVLLWKYNYTNGLPYVYVNADYEKADKVFNHLKFTYEEVLLDEWFKVPGKKEDITFFHGEKRVGEMQKMLNLLSNNMSDNFLWDNTYAGFKETIIREIFEDRIYEKLFSVEEGDVVFDIGASVGPFTYSILNKNPKHVFCFEPSYPEFKTLMLNVRQGPVTCINKGITDKIGKCGFKFIFEDHNEAYSTTFKQIIEDYNLSKIDFLKTDCEGGEYDIFTKENTPWIINNIKKVVGEWHLSNPDLKSKFRTFRDTYLSMFNNYKIFSIDGVDITRNVWSEEFIQYYTEVIIYIDNRKINKMKVLFVAPHLSTGGMPAFLLKRIEVLQKFEDVEMYVVEYADVSPDYIVQKNRIKELVSNFHTIYEDKMELMSIIKNNDIDVVHIDEMAESLGANYDLLSSLYSPDRTWKIVETCHNVAFNPDQSKLYHPDAYAFCTPYHENVFANMSGFKKTIEFPIDPKPVSEEDRFQARMQLGIDLFKKHVVNVGLWTPGKNQGEGLEIAKRFPNIQFHFVGNQAPNFASYWIPLMKDIPSNVKIWGERSDVDVFMKAADVFMFNSTWECNPLVLREAISYGLPIIARNLPQYEDMFTPYLQPMHTYLTDIKCQYIIPTDNTSDVFGDSHYNLYKSVISSPISKQKALGINIKQHFIEKPFIEITGQSDSVFDVRFYDENNLLYHRDLVKSNHWVRLSRGYYTKWRTEIWENGNLIYENVLNLEGKRVYICFDSASLGDTVAWMPYAEEFRKKHKCHVIVSTFKNFLFKNVYPNVEFVNPGDIVPNIYAQYKIGWFYNSDMEPALPNTINLQECAANILGLDYQEIRPKIAFTPGNNSYGKFVTIATNSTAGCKFWTKEGWQAVINYLVEKGYDVINVSKEPNPFDNCMQLHDTSMEHTMDVIHHSEFFIGLSSGLSWLAWAMNKKVVMISNFTEDNHEFECIRITNKAVCHGCWNKAEYKFDKGDWNWCPIHKGTDRMFECHTSISPQMVIDEIKKAGF